MHHLIVVAVIAPLLAGESIVATDRAVSSPTNEQQPHIQKCTHLQVHTIRGIQARLSERATERRRTATRDIHGHGAFGVRG